ncbi:hypothetical protein Tco_0512508 [Tanacetum coccineum]
MGCRRRKKKVSVRGGVAEEVKKSKPKTILNANLSFLLAQERNQIDDFLKGQGYKNITKAVSTDEGYLYDKDSRIHQRLLQRILSNVLRERKDSCCRRREAKRLLKDWEIIRWRLNESSGVHTLELEDGTMIHMLAERRYPLSKELMIRMLDHGMEVEEDKFRQPLPCIRSIQISEQLKYGDESKTTDSQTDCIQDITSKIMSRRLKTCIDAEQGVQPSRNLKSSE